MKLIHLSVAAAALRPRFPNRAVPDRRAAGWSTRQDSELPSGLKYTDTTLGTGTEATKGKKSSVHYTGWLYTNGAKGTNSTARSIAASRFVRAGRRPGIRGWDEGVAGMKIGGKRT